MSNIVQYKKHYNVFIKWIEDPLKVSSEWGEILMKILADKWCPPFININDWLYNIYEISKVIPHEEKITPERAEALADMERLKTLLWK
jgi:hypothetical protein